MPASPLSSLSSSPSFSAYSNGDLEEIAARVIEELRAENGTESEFFEDENDVFLDSSNGDEEEFEFAFVPGGAAVSPISADEIFCNGQIRPIFNRNHEEFETERKKKIRVPLGKLLREEREAHSCSSSEAEEMEGIPAEMYCVWRPKASSSSPENSSSPARICKKSNSTGGWSKRWKLRDLIRRSNSDGNKDTFVFFTPSFKKEAQKLENQTPDITGKSTSPRDFVGFFANVNGFSRNLQPF